MGFVPSVCPYCSCGCGLLLATQDGRLVGTHPSVAHPSSQGSLCMRGWNAAEAPHHPDRLTAPLVRENGKLVQASAEKALATIGQRLTALAGKQGASVLFGLGPSCTNEDAYAVKRLARELKARACPTDLGGFPAARRAIHKVLGRGHLPGGLEHVGSADLVWIFGVDLKACPQVASRLSAARRRGARVVRFDVFAASAKDLSHMSVGVPPEQFGLLPLLLQRAALGRGRIPAAAKAAPSFARLAEAWASGKAPSLAERPWLPDARVDELVAGFLDARAPTVIIGERWLSAAGSGEATIQLVQALALLGAQERIVFATGEVNSWGTWDILAPEKEDTEALLGLLDPSHQTKLDAVIIVGDDLLRRAAQPAPLAEKLARAGLVVVIDRFHSETEACAHVVLPATTFAERDGTVTNSFGLVQRWREAIRPAGESAAECDWIARIGRRLGIEGWPAAPAEWLEALKRDSPTYRNATLARLYDGTDGAGVLLEETTTLTFSPPRFAAAPSTSKDVPFKLCFASHPAVWSTGVLSERDEILRREVNQSLLYLSPADLARLKLRAGSPVKVISERVEAPMTVREETRLPGGVGLAVPLPGSAAWALRGFFPEADSQSLATHPVPIRLEPA